MNAAGFLNRILFLVGIFQGLLVFQTEHWRKKLRFGFRFLLLAFFSSQAYLISEIMDKLPKNTWNDILRNLFEPGIFFSVFVICIFGCWALSYMIMAGKVMKSLVG